MRRLPKDFAIGASSIFVAVPHAWYTRPEWTGPDRHRRATRTRRSSRYVQTRRERAERKGVAQPLGLVRADEGRRRSTSSRLREQCSNHRLQRGRRVAQARSFASPCVIIAPPRAWQAVVTCLPLSDKAASAHVAALSHCQRYEPTGTATCPVERHALGLSLRRASALTPKPVLPWPPAEALHSAEPKPVLPPSLDLPPSRPGLRPNHSVQSLGSLMGDCAELEGLGTRFPSTFPAISAPLSSIVAMGPDDVPSPRSGQVRSRDSSRCGR